MNELNQRLVNSTLCRHERKEAKDSRNGGNPTVSRCGSAASRWSQKGSNNSHVHPRRAEDRHTSEGGWRLKECGFIPEFQRDVPIAACT